MKTLLRCCLLLALTSLACAESGGPDGAGYVFTRAATAQPFASIVGVPGAFPVAGDNPTENQDDILRDVALGFTFRFYGADYTHVTFSSNGLIFPGTVGSTDFTNVDFTAIALSPDLPAIAAYWDDLVFRSGQPGGLWLLKRTVDGVKEIVLEWDRVSLVSVPAALLTFQAILREDGSITCFYPDTDTGNSTISSASSATLGLRDAGGHNSSRRLQPKFGDGGSTSPYLVAGDRIDYRLLPDERETALDFTGRLISPRVDTFGALKNLSTDPNVTGGTENSSVWFRWTPPGPGRAVFSTAGSTFDTVLAVLHGFTGATLSLDDDGGGDGTSRSAVLSADDYLIMVAGKQGGPNPTTGIAQLSVAFQAADVVRFSSSTVQAVEGQTASVQLSRAFIHKDPLSVEVQVTDPSGALTTLSAGSSIGGFLFPAQITPPDDGVFTPGQRYTLAIVGGAGLYTRGIDNFTCEVEVLDNDPIRLPAMTFTGAFFGGNASGGQITLSLGRTGAFSGKYVQGALAKSFRGQIDAFGRALVPLTLPGQPATALEIELRFDNVTGQLQAATELVGLNVVAPFLTTAPYSAANPAPAGVPGRYSLSWTPTGGAYASHGSVTVSTSGAVKAAGTLFDGTKFAFGSKLRGQSAAAAFTEAHARTHGGNGTLTAVLAFGASSAQLQTVRPAGLRDPRTSAFLAGYNDFAFLGRLARYTPPAAGAQPSAGFTTTQGRGTFGLGAAGALTNTADFTLAPTGKATSPTAGFTLTLDPKTGLYRGTRPNPTPGGKPVPFSGVLDQLADQGTGAGTGFGISHDATTAHGAFFVPRP